MAKNVKEKKSNTKKVEKKTTKTTAKKDSKKVETKKEKVGFLKAVKMELSKVKWAEGKDIFKYSGATLAFCVFLGLFFQALNILMTFIKGLF